MTEPPRLLCINSDRQYPYASPILCTLPTVRQRSWTAGRGCLFTVVRDRVIYSRVGTLNNDIQTDASECPGPSSHSCNDRKSQMSNGPETICDRTGVALPTREREESTSMCTLYNLGVSDCAEENQIALLARSCSGVSSRARSNSADNPTNLTIHAF